ncbi:MAG: aquaporin family protein [Granulosicoccus sp.]|nr:aquaporin family protein [Granulosicoccus sp.]
MSVISPGRRFVAEFIGTAFLLATVIGSGIMAAALADGNDAIALLGNTIATGAILVVLITILGPLSGAHFNPAVTLVFAIRREISIPHSAIYILMQILGALFGMLIAHSMFDLELLQFSEKLRTGGAQWLAEGVATFGLLTTILLTIRFRPDGVAMMVGLYITAAYWFTASTSFANPAVTIARSFTNTFSGIYPGHTPMFIVSQFTGAILAMWLCHYLMSDHKER